MQTIFAVRVNEGIIALVPTDDISVAHNALTAFARDHYQRNKSSFAAFPSYEDYMEANRDNWRLEKFISIDSIAELDRQLNPATRDHRIHNAANFPHPSHQKMPMQKQFPRIQLPAVKPATQASTHSHPTPGVPREHQRVHQLDATIREEQAIQDQQ